MGQGYEERVSSDIAGTRDDLARNVDALNEKVNPSRVIERRKHALRSRVGSVKDTIMGTAHSVQGSAQDATGTVSDRASSMAESATHAAQDATSTIRERSEGNPLAAGLIAFGAGMLISAVIPASEKESRAAQRVVDAAKEHGQPVIDEAKSMGQEIGENVKDKASEAAAEVKSSAQESAQHVGEEGRSAGQTVKNDAQSKAR